MTLKGAHFLPPRDASSCLHDRQPSLGQREAVWEKPMVGCEVFQPGRAPRSIPSHLWNQTCYRELGLPRRSQELMKEMGREHFNCSLRPVSPRPGNLKGVREQLGESRKRPTAGQLCSRWPSSRRTFAKAPSEASWANAWSIQEGQLEYCDHLPEFSQLLKCFSCSALSRLFMLHLCGWSFFHGLPLRELYGIVVCTAPFIPLVPGSLGSRRWEEQALRRAEGSPAQPLS